MAVIDAHQHLWNLNRVEYPWLDQNMGPVFRTIEEPELEPQLAAAGVDRTVIVQSADSAADTDYMTEVADRWPRIAGIVGWVPLDRPEEADKELDRRTADPRFVGVRHLIHTEADPDWVVRPQVQEGLGLLAERALAFDVVAVLPRHLEHVPVLAERHPSLRLVIDHLAKPPIREGGWEPWATLLRRAAAYPTVYAKVSGLNTAAEPETWSASDLRRYVDHALDCFGPDRLMYGGDWPIATLAGDYAKVWRETNAVLAGLGQADRDRILGGTAADFYRLAV